VSRDPTSARYQLDKYLDNMRVIEQARCLIAVQQQASSFILVQ
jgi:hypothetical protein